MPAAEVLIESGADTNARAAHDLTPLHYAIGMTARATVVDLLIKNHADIDARDDEGLTPLKMALDQYGKYPTPNLHDIVKMLKEKGARIK